MFKYLALVVSGIFMMETAKCQKADTAVFYYRYDLNGYYRVNTPDSADFLRLITRPGTFYNYLDVQEYFKNGKIKFVGKSETGLPRTFTTGDISLDGDCISYYANGIKQNISHYTHGQKDGMEYLYNYDGSIYCVLKNEYHGYAIRPTVLYWECYDPKGTMICKGGNGWWITYDNERIKSRGQVKNGLMDGEWKGSMKMFDSIKYACQYKEGKLVSGVGYDKNGKAFPFVESEEKPCYNNRDPITFVQVLREHFKMPGNFDRNKIKLDTAHVSFIIEKDGSISNAKFLGVTDSALTSNLKEAFLKCKGWTTAKYYGVPFRVRIVFPYKENGEIINNGFGSTTMYRREIRYRAEVIGS